MNLHERLLAQLAIDYNTTHEALSGTENLFTRNAPDLRKRVYLNRDAGPLHVLCLGSIAVLCCGSDALLEAMRAKYANFNAAWFLSIRNLNELNELLFPFGARIAHHQLYFLPTGRFPAPRPELALRWYEADELERFRGDARFQEALNFAPDMPDMLAVTAESGDEILGMAGASRDAERFWQIGINVLPSARRRGIASALTAALAQELLARDVLPFYGTAPSHIFSQRTALNAGFLPAWTELRAEPLNTEPLIKED